MLRKQAEALLIALGSEGFQKRLTQQIANIDQAFRQAEELTLQQFELGKTELEKQGVTNEAQRSRGLLDSVLNAGRERAEALSEAAANGAGLIDSLRVQAASLRNWQFNTAEAQTDFMDSQQSLESAASELENTVLAQRSSAWRTAEQGRAQAYASYYSDRAEVLTDIGNKYGEAAQYWGSANELEPNAGRAGGQASDKDLADRYFREASQEAGKSYAERAIPESITKWKGNTRINKENPLAFARVEFSAEEAEGARLRRWAG
jgi:hypothetical protein